GFADVFIPDHLMLILGHEFLAHAVGHHDIEIAVAIHVHGVAMNRGSRLVINHVLLPGLRRRLTRILIPDNAGTMLFHGRYVRRDVLRADGRGEQINLAVTIEVSRPDGPRLRHLVVDDVSGPLAIPTVLTGVLVPGDEPAGIARDRRVQIAV